MSAAAIQLQGVTKAFRRREREAGAPWWRREWKDKVAVALSFLTAPSLLRMDEPTTGLDPRSKKEVQAALQLLRAEREVTVLLCTHDMDEAAALCDRVLMMDEGRVLADGSPEELGHRYSHVEGPPGL